MLNNTDIRYPPYDPRGELFRVYALVYDAVTVRRCADPPTGTFTQMFQNRPDDCRYMVAGQWDWQLNGDRYHAFDMFHVKKDLVTGAIVTPRPRLSHDDLDAAIMATVLLFGR